MHRVQEGAVIGPEIEGFELSRETYASMYGPTTGDRIRLGDTELWVEVEADRTVYGEELKFGGGAFLRGTGLRRSELMRSLCAGKVIREGMGQATGLPDSETLDLVITNALIIDWSGIYKVRVLPCETERRSTSSFAGRYRGQRPPHRRHRQGRQSRRDGRRDSWHDRRRQHGGHRRREAHCDCGSGRHAWCVVRSFDRLQLTSILLTQFTTSARNSATRYAL